MFAGSSFTFHILCRSRLKSPTPHVGKSIVIIGCGTPTPSTWDALVMKHALQKALVTDEKIEELLADLESTPAYNQTPLKCTCRERTSCNLHHLRKPRRTPQRMRHPEMQKKNGRPVGQIGVKKMANFRRNNNLFR